MRLITWNIQWGRGIDGRVDLQRIVEHVRRFADVDVLCLQEVSAGYPELAGCDGADQFAALADLMPAYTAVAGVATETRSPVAGTRRAFGNLVLSRVPVLQVFRHLLPWPAHAGVKSMQRVALEAHVQSPSGPLRIVTTHLEYYSAAQRVAQVERLRELQREAFRQARCARPGTAEDGPFEHVPRGASAVLTGDFNCGPASSEMARLLAPFADAVREGEGQGEGEGEGDGDDGGTPGWVDAWPLVHGQRPHAPTVGVHDHGQWPGGARTFDFVLVSADMASRVSRVEVDSISDASDHQPVLVEWRD